MNRTAAKLLLVILALSVTPLNASSALSPAHGVRISPAPIATALAALPAPLTEAEFFEAVNHTSGPGYAVGAQGSQHMVISISISVPGDLPAIPPPDPGALPLDAGQYAVDSFFDISTELSVDGGPPGPGSGLADPPLIDTGGFPGTDLVNPTPPPGALDNPRYNEDYLGIETKLQKRFSDRWQTGPSTAPSADDFFDTGANIGPGGASSGGAASTTGGGGSSGSGATSATGGSSSGSGAATAGGSPAGGPAPGSSGFFDGIISGDHKIESRFLHDIGPNGDLAFLTASDGTFIIPTGGELDATAFQLSCANAPASPACTAGGEILENGIDLLTSCSAGDSPLCDELLPPDLLLGEPDTYLLVIDGFGDATGDGAYTLSIDPATVGSCAATPAGPGCGELLDVVDSLNEFDDACSGDGSELCESFSSLPDFLDGETFDDGAEIEDWYTFTIDDASIVTLATSPPATTPLDTEILLFDLDALDICGSDPATPNCAPAGEVVRGVIDLHQTCEPSDDGMCGAASAFDPSLAPGTYLLRVEFGDSFGPGGGEYTLDINLDPEVVSGCSANPEVLGCSELNNVVSGLQEFAGGCGADPSPACSEAARSWLATEQPGEFRLALWDTSDSALDTVQPDWYTFTLDAGSVVTIETAPTDRSELDPDFLLFELDEFAPCQADPSLPNCSAAGLFFVSALDALETCGAEGSPVCDQLLDIDVVGASTYYVVIDGFDDAPGDYILSINPETASTCAADPETRGCSEFNDLVTGLYGYDQGCGANPSPVCFEGALASEDDSEALDYVWDIVADGGVASGAGSAPAGRSFNITPGNDPGHLVLRETGDSTGIFRVAEEVYYTFRPTDSRHLGPIFAGLPPRSTVLTSGHRIKLSPDGKHLLFYDNDGNILTVDDSVGAPTGALIGLTPDISDPTKVVFTGGSKRIVIPVPGVPLLSPNDLASTAEEITNAAATGGVVATATAKGGSSGPVFDIRVLNFGKSATAVEGDVIVEPLEGPVAAAVRAALLDAMGAVNSVQNGPADAYCVEQDKGVPTDGQLFAITNAGKQQEFAFAVAVLDGSRAVEAAGLLNPDSDPTAYTHSIRQWAIWTVEKRFDKDGFAQSFVDQTKKTWPTINEQRRAAGMEEVPWTAEIEGAIRSLVDNRWEDIQRIIGASNLPADAA